MNNMMKTLQQLRQLRQRALNQSIGQLAQKKQLSQRYQCNINALTALTLTDEKGPPGLSALQLANHAYYKRHIQRVIDWQQQEQVLVDLETQKLHLQVQQQACREKIAALILAQHQQEYRFEQARLAQKNTDAQAAQCWQRQLAR